MSLVRGGSVSAPALHETVLQGSRLHNGVKPHRGSAHRRRERPAGLSACFGTEGLFALSKLFRRSPDGVHGVNTPFREGTVHLTVGACLPRLFSLSWFWCCCSAAAASFTAGDASLAPPCAWIAADCGVIEGLWQAETLPNALWSRAIGRARGH
jgi:hypothetical protein